MKKYLFICILLSLLEIQHTSAQEIKGKPILKVYANYNHGLMEGDRSTAFEIRRSYLGYSYDISEHFNAEVKLDIGSPEDQSQYSLIRRYAYFKTAALRYQKENLTAWFGLIDMLHYEIQEDFWGYRYIYKSFQDEYKFGPSADIGFAAKYRLNDYIETELVISNGEGYKNLQTDDRYKTAAGITIYPAESLVMRLYYDFLNEEVLQQTYNVFLGYYGKNYRIGGEHVIEKNSSDTEGYEKYGWSFFGTWEFNDQWEIFGRYDRLNSNLPGESDLPWNIYNDGTAFLTGLQYQPVQGINLSLNYQDWYSLARNGQDRAYIYFNVEFKI